MSGPEIPQLPFISGRCCGCEAPPLRPPALLNRPLNRSASAGHTLCNDLLPDEVMPLQLEDAPEPSREEQVRVQSGARGFGPGAWQERAASRIGPGGGGAGPGGLSAVARCCVSFDVSVAGGEDLGLQRGYRSPRVMLGARRAPRPFSPRKLQRKQLQLQRNGISLHRICDARAGSV